MRDSEIRFIRQLGYSTHPTRELYAALMLQPMGATITAWALEGLLICAVAAVVFGSNCAGAALYHRLRRQSPSEAGFTPTPHARRS